MNQALLKELTENVRSLLDEDIEAYEKAKKHPMPVTVQRAKAHDFTRRVLNDYAETGRQPRLTPDEEDELTQAIRNALFAAAQMQPLLEDPEIQEIRAFGCDNVWLVSINGGADPGPPLAENDDKLVELIQLLANEGIGERQFHAGSPKLDVHLRTTWHRVCAIHPAVAVRPVLIVRRHECSKLARLTDQLAVGMVSPELAALEAAAVRARKNIVVSGGPSTGKTTHVRALANEIPSTQHVVTIEDTFELGLHLDLFKELHPQVTPLCARLPNVEGKGEVSPSDLALWALRLSPDRVIVGEVRGKEVRQLVSAMTQGSDGSLSSVHASDSAGALERLRTLLMEWGGSPIWAAQALGEAVDLVVHLEKVEQRGRKTERFVSSVREVLSAKDGTIVSSEIFRPEGPDGRAVPNLGAMSDRLLDDLERAGLDVNLLESAEAAAS